VRRPSGNTPRDQDEHKYRCRRGGLVPVIARRSGAFALRRQRDAQLLYASFSVGRHFRAWVSGRSGCSIVLRRTSVSFRQLGERVAKRLARA
jgi:hypothetical protein